MTEAQIAALEARRQVEAKRRVGLNVSLIDDRGVRVVRRTSMLEELGLVRAMWWSSPLTAEATKLRIRGYQVAAVNFVALFAMNALNRRGLTSTIRLLPFAIAVSFLVCHILARFTSAYRARQSLWQRAYPQALAEGWCPACDYRLEGLACEADDYTVCPECGAAWSLATSPQHLQQTSTAPGNPSSAASSPPRP